MNEIDEKLLKFAQNDTTGNYHRVSNRHKLYKQIISYYGMIQDIDNAIRALQSIVDYEEDDFMFQNLWQIATIRYTRCFTSSQNGYSYLTKDVFKTNERVSIHEKLMDIRNKYLGHREDNEFENPLVLFQIIADTGGDIRIETIINQATKIGPDIEEHENVLTHFLGVKKLVEEKLSKVIKKLSEEIDTKYFTIVDEALQEKLKAIESE